MFSHEVDMEEKCVCVYKYVCICMRVCEGGSRRGGSGKGEKTCAERERRERGAGGLVEVFFTERDLRRESTCMNEEGRACVVDVHVYVTMS